MRLPVVLAALFLLAAEAPAAEISRLQQNDGSVTVAVKGEITRGDAGTLAGTLEKAKAVSGSIVLSLDSPGGSLLEGLEMADLIHDHAIRTYVGADAKCISACAIMFMAGSRKVDGELSPDRMLHPSGTLAFHAPSLSKGIFGEDGNTPVPIAGTVERQILAAALKFSDLTVRHGWQPSLVRAALSARKEGELVYVTTVEDAGRWFIRLDAEEPLRVLGGLAASHVCGNLLDWISDESSDNDSTGLPANTYRRFLSNLPTIKNPIPKFGDNWADYVTQHNGYANATAEGRQVGTEDMTEYCQLNTDLDGRVEGLRIYSDEQSRVALKLKNDSHVRPIFKDRLFAWHMLPPHIKLVDLHKYAGDSAVISEQLFDHNGSKMLPTGIATGDGEKQVTIDYFDPKESLSGLVHDGKLLFEGRSKDGRIEGTARTFRRNCPDAAYEVTGTWSADRIELTGAAPRRVKSGCKVVGYDWNSGNTKLGFTRIDR